MESLSLWLVVIQLTPACFTQRHQAYEACVANAPKIGATCAAEPTVYQGINFSLGKPRIEVPKGQEGCYEILAAKLGGKAKPINLEKWNKDADALAHPIK